MAKDKDKEQANHNEASDKPLEIEILESLEAAAGKPQRLVYCGPSFPGGRLNQFTVYKGGFPDYLDDLVAFCPAVKELFVPVEELAKTRIVLGQPGSEASNLFNEVWHYIKKEVNSNV